MKRAASFVLMVMACSAPCIVNAGKPGNACVLTAVDSRQGYFAGLNGMNDDDYGKSRYFADISEWLASLPPPQRERARLILREEHPGMHALSLAIREKKAQLESLSFGRGTRPDTLPRLGKELQELREVLREELGRINQRLLNEVGARMGPLEDDVFWLMPPDCKPAGKSRH